MPRTRKGKRNRDGINILDVWAAKGKSEGKRWLYRVRDPLVRDYKRKVFGSHDVKDKHRKIAGCAEGDDWAITTQQRLGLGLDTASKADISFVAANYLEDLRGQRPPAHPTTIRNVELTRDRLTAAGVSDLGEKGIRLKVQKWLKDFTADKSKAGGGVVSESTRQRYLIHTRARISYAMRRGWMVSDPLSDLTVDVPDPNREVFSLAELRHLAGLRKPADDFWVWTMLMVYTGMRREESLLLLWSDIDWQARVISVQKGKGRGGGKRRTVYMMDEVYNLLAAINGPKVKTRRVGRIFNYRPDAGYVLERFRKLLTTAGFSWERGIDPITNMPRRLSPHSCRHSFAALMLATGADGTDLRMTLGHSAGDITEHYARQRDTFRRQVQHEGWGRGQFYLMRRPPKSAAG